VLLATIVSAAVGSSAQAQGNEGSPNHNVRAFNTGVPVEPTCSTNRVEASASLLFLQPGTGNLRYATLISPLPPLTPHWSDEAVSLAFSAAFDVGIRYVFGCCGDIQLDWTHLRANDSASAVAGPTQAIGPSFLIGPPPPYASASGVAHFAYDAAYLDAGLFANFGHGVQLRPFIGLEGARINHVLYANFQSADGSISFADPSQSTFTGVGPRLGLDMHYLCGNFDFLGGIAGAALIGRQQSRIDFITSSPIATANGLNPNLQYLTSPDSTQVIPSLDATVGGSYAIALGRRGVLKCEAGYQAAVFINAVNLYSLTEVENGIAIPFEGNASVFLRSAVGSQSNFFVHGPYLKVGIEF
jgi:hypothetical protein